jgi:hypothetical protein
VKREQDLIRWLLYRYEREVREFFAGRVEG